MKLPVFLRAAAALAAASLLSVPASAAPFLNGTYVIDGGGYSIDVQLKGDTLVVVEPNKTSTYARQSDGTYHFTNPNNGILYGLRILDERTIEAFKPGSGGGGTVLHLFGRGTPSGASKSATEPGPGLDVPKASPADQGAIAEKVAANPKYEVLAKKYSDLTQSDLDNVQANAACAAVAMKRSVASEAEAEAYAAKMKAMLSEILVNPSTNPCPDVFTRW